MNGVTAYPVIGFPPSDAGAVHESVALASPATARPIVGASGTVSVGVTVLDTSDLLLVPIAFVACTQKWYLVPFFRPVMTCVVAAESNTRAGSLTRPMSGVTVYPVIGEPFAKGFSHDTVTAWLPGTTSPMIGTSGFVGNV